MTAVDGTASEQDVLLDADEIAALHELTGLQGLLGLDGGSGYLQTWARPDRGATSLLERGLVSPDEADEGHERVAPALRTALAALFAGSARAGLLVANGVVRGTLLFSFTKDVHWAAVPQTGAGALQVRLCALDDAQVQALVETSLGAPVQPGERTGPEHVVPLKGFVGLVPRLMTEPGPEQVLRDLQHWGLEPDEAEALLGYCEEGGRSVTVQALTRPTPDTVVVDQEVYFGRGDAWWSADEQGDDLTLRQVSHGTALAAVLRLVLQTRETVR